MRLLNLETGEVVADASFENPQRFGGSDVMSRIQFDTEDKSKLLQRTLAGYITHAIEEFPVDPQTIYELVVAGNSTMRDLFFRLNVYSIGQNPYQSITELEMAEGKRTTTSLTESAKKLLLPLHPQARVYGMPIISGHVGADAAACMLAIDLANEERIVAVMDIGTNTELILGNRHKILAASCPAGPAFEGGAIACGMPGLPGAIEKVAINDDGSLRVQVIGDGPAEGICGSGLVDLLGELLRTERINALGRFEHGEDRFVLDVKSDAPVYFSESDINELAQAKGANVAGLQVIFNNYGIRFDEVDVFYLAGGFGRHLNIAVVQTHRIDSRYCRRENFAGRQRFRRRRVHRAAVADETRGAGKPGPACHALPAGNASAFFRLLRRGLPVQSGHLRAFTGVAGRARRINFQNDGTGGKQTGRQRAGSRIQTAARLSAPA